MTEPKNETVLVEVQPTNHVIVDGEKYEYEYTFDKVYIDDVPDDIECSVNGAELWWEHGILHYQYGDRTEIYITEDGTYCEQGEAKIQATEQAYYALSVLSSRGLVGRFTKQ